jgi:glycine cleavage system H protein
LQVNEGLEDKPSVINKDPYGEGLFQCNSGWIAKIELSDPKELEGMMNDEAYTKFTSE